MVLVHSIPSRGIDGVRFDGLAAYARASRPGESEVIIAIMRFGYAVSWARFSSTEPSPPSTFACNGVRPSTCLIYRAFSSCDDGPAGAAH